MRSKDIVWKKYDNLREQSKNLIITPKGQVLTIEYQSHDYYLEKLIEDEYGIDEDQLREFKYAAKKQDKDAWPREENIIIAKFGYISVHTSGRGIAWIQLPPMINDEQMSAIKTEYALGNIPPLIYDVLMNYETLVEEINDYFGDRPWWRPYQIDIEIVKEKESWHTDKDFENGYSVSIH